MENKNLDGQLSFDGDLGLNNPENEKQPEIPVVEFQIGKPAEEENLIFEVIEDKKEKSAEASVAAAPIVEEFVIGTPPANNKHNQKTETTPVVQSGSQTTDSEEVASAQPAVRRGVYVPRFTEASEKYRKTVDTRSRASMYDLRRSAKVEVDNASVRAERIITDDIDPTAEIEVAPESQVVVNVTNVEPEPEMLNVFKFQEAEPKQEQKPEEPTLESEIQEIERLITPEHDAEDKTDAAQQVNEIDKPIAADEVDKDAEYVEEAAESSCESEKETADYELPDPDSKLIVQDYTEEIVGDKEPDHDFVMPDENREEKQKVVEFTHQSQRDSFKDRFLDTAMAHKIRIGMICVFALTLLGVEFFAAIGYLTPRLIRGSSYLGTLAVFDFLLVSCVFLLALPESVKAVKKLCEKNVSFDIALPLGFAVSLIYYIILVVAPARHYSLYGFVFAVYALIAVLASYYRNLGDFLAFKQVSKNSEKKILDVKMTRELPEENIALDGLVDEYTSKTTRIFRAAFVADFFNRTSKNTENKKHIITLFAIPMCVALVSAVIAFFIPGGLVSAVSAFALVYLLSCPAFIMLSGKIPYFDAQLAALSEESAVIGEKSFDDFSEVDVIAFEDTEIFGPEDVNLKRFMLYGERDDIERAMRQMYSLFSVVGGPLYKIFANALDNRVRHTPAMNVQIESDGVSGEISGARILAGSESYMKRHGIAVPGSGAQTDVGADTTKIMYAAENGEVHAKFYIRYSFSEEFTMLLPSLREQGIVPLIYTNDPNLSNELLKTLCAGADCMRVVKKLEPRAEADKIYRRVSAGVITFGDKINAINTILLTRKYKQFSNRMLVSALYSLSIAAAVALIIATLGASLPSLVYGIWHIGWCAAIRIVSRKNFTEEKKDNK